MQNLELLVAFSLASSRLIGLCLADLQFGTHVARLMATCGLRGLSHLDDSCSLLASRESNGNPFTLSRKCNRCEP